MHKILMPLCSLLLAACGTPNSVHTDVPRTTAPYNEVPVSANFPTTTQLKLQAAQHWAQIADDTAKAISALLSKGSLCLPSARTCRPVYVNPPTYITGFSRTFHNQLITTMVSSGMNVSKEPEASVLIDIDVQPVLFAPNRPQYRFAGKATELGPGVWALRDVASMDPNDPRITPPKPDALHWFRTEFASGQTPQMEIVVTVSASDKTRYLARTTNVYYVTEGDWRLYDQEICALIHTCLRAPSVTVEERKPEMPKSRPARSIGITGDCPLDRKCCPSDKPCPEEGGKTKTGGRKS